MNWALSWGLGVEQDQYPELGQIADTPCGPIEYAVAGHGTPVVVVHGAGGGFDQGMLFAEMGKDESRTTVGRIPANDWLSRQNLGELGQAG